MKRFVVSFCTGKSKTSSNTQSMRARKLMILWKHTLSSMTSSCKTFIKRWRTNSMMRTIISSLSISEAMTGWPSLKICWTKSAMTASNPSMSSWLQSSSKWTKTLLISRLKRMLVSKKNGKSLKTSPNNQPKSKRQSSQSRKRDLSSRESSSKSWTPSCSAKETR